MFSILRALFGLPFEDFAGPPAVEDVFAASEHCCVVHAGVVASELCEGSVFFFLGEAVEGVAAYGSGLEYPRRPYGYVVSGLFGEVGEGQEDYYVGFVGLLRVEFVGVVLSVV